MLHADNSNEQITQTLYPSSFYEHFAWKSPSDGKKRFFWQHIVAHHIESRAFHVKQRKNRKNPRFWMRGAKRLPCTTWIVPRRSAPSTICQRTQSPVDGVFWPLFDGAFWRILVDIFWSLFVGALWLLLMDMCDLATSLPLKTNQATMRTRGALFCGTLIISRKCFMWNICGLLLLKRSFC